MPEGTSSPGMCDSPSIAGEAYPRFPFAITISIHHLWAIACLCLFTNGRVFIIGIVNKLLPIASVIKI